MILDMLKGFLVGVCASAPVGPIAILVIQKSLSKGHKAGFVAGLGASVVDTLYAFIAIFALAFAQRFIEQHQNIILLAGGSVLIILGFSMAFSNPFRKMKKDDKPKVSSKDFGQAVLMGLSNPMAIRILRSGQGCSAYMECGSDPSVGQSRFRYILVLGVMASEPFLQRIQDEDDTLDKQDNRRNNSNNRHLASGTGTVQCRVPRLADSVNDIWKSQKYSLRT